MGRSGSAGSGREDREDRTGSWFPFDGLRAANDDVPCLAPLLKVLAVEDSEGVFSESWFGPF